MTGHQAEWWLLAAQVCVCSSSALWKRLGWRRWVLDLVRDGGGGRRADGAREWLISLSSVEFFASS